MNDTKKMEKMCVHRARMPLLPAKVNSGTTAEWKSGQVRNRTWPFFHDP